MWFWNLVKHNVACKPLPVHICRNPLFGVHLNSLIVGVDIFSLPIERQLPTFNSCIREASRRVHLTNAHEEGDSIQSLRASLASISRAIWLRNVPLARKLQRHSALARELMVVTHDNVYCTDHSRFDELFDSSHQQFQLKRLKELSHSTSRCASPNLRKQLGSKIRPASRM